MSLTDGAQLETYYTASANSKHAFFTCAPQLHGLIVIRVMRMWSTRVVTWRIAKNETLERKADGP